MPVLASSRIYLRALHHASREYGYDDGIRLTGTLRSLAKSSFFARLPRLHAACQKKGPRAFTFPVQARWFARTLPVAHAAPCADRCPLPPRAVDARCQRFVSWTWGESAARALFATHTSNASLHAHTAPPAAEWQPRACDARRSWRQQRKLRPLRVPFNVDRGVDQPAARVRQQTANALPPAADTLGRAVGGLGHPARPMLRSSPQAAAQSTGALPPWHQRGML